MTSYRIALGIGSLRPGVRPDVVLPAAADAARRMTTVESFDLAVVRGEARINVRFTAEGNDEAARIARGVHGAVDALAGVTTPDLSRRNGARWQPVPWRP